MAGIDVKVASDIDRAGLETLSSALGTPTICKDVQELAASELRRAGKVKTPDIVFGGPPCTPFSHAGFWLDQKRLGKDPARNLLQEYMRLVATLKPKAFLFENVPGLAFSTHQRFLNQLVGRAKKAGYSTAWSILRADQFGVPQTRRRLILIGLRNKPVTPIEQRQAAPLRTARWAIGDLARKGTREHGEVPRGEYQDLLHQIPPGGNYIHFTNRGVSKKPLFKYRGRYWSFLMKINPELPAPTLPATRVTYNGPFHWNNRHLRVREMARLQTFPDWWPLNDDLPTARRHLGNAVPPLFAAQIFESILENLGLAAHTNSRPIQRLKDPQSSIRDILSVMPKAQPRRMKVYD